MALNLLKVQGSAKRRCWYRSGRCVCVIVPVRSMSMVLRQLIVPVTVTAALVELSWAVGSILILTRGGAPALNARGDSTLCPVWYSWARRTQLATAQSTESAPRFVWNMSIRVTEYLAENDPVGPTEIVVASKPHSLRVSHIP